jgi:hypothetical protein
LDQVIYDQGGGRAVRSAIGRVQTAAAHLDRALGYVPEQWWSRLPAPVADELKQALDARMRRLPDILNIKKRENMENATRGGYILF